MNYPKKVTVIELENAPFKGAKPAYEWATSHGIVIVRLYGCVSLGGIMYRAKTTLKRYVDPNEKTKAYSYEISNIEVLKGVAGFVTRPSDKPSMDVNILLNDVCDVNGVPLLKKIMNDGSSVD